MTTPVKICHSPAAMDDYSALVAAELIDAANLSPVAVLIADVWVSKEDID